MYRLGAIILYTINELQKSREGRNRLLQAIKSGSKEDMANYKKEMDVYLKDDSLNILKRNPKSRIRSYKNLLLSHNTLYSFFAEEGGLSPSQGHYISEKYAIMIEDAKTFPQLDHLHLLMLEEYSDSSIRLKNKANHTLVEKVINYIEMNFSEDISISEMAQKLHVNSSHLMRVFKKAKGITISHYRQKIRIKEAKELLLYTDLLITEVALMVGFNSSQYFSRIFTKEECMTPKEYRKNGINFRY